MTAVRLPPDGVVPSMPGCRTTTATLTSRHHVCGVSRYLKRDNLPVSSVKMDSNDQDQGHGLSAITIDKREDKNTDTSTDLEWSPGVCRCWWHVVQSFPHTLNESVQCSQRQPLCRSEGCTVTLLLRGVAAFPIWFEEFQQVRHHSRSDSITGTWRPCCYLRSTS